MLQARFKKHVLKFITPGGTSRGVLTTKNSWYLYVCDDANPDVVGIGECSVLPALSIDDRNGYEEKLANVCASINDYSTDYHTSLEEWPSIRFGLEIALLDLKNGGCRTIFPSSFVEGETTIPINGLIWMGEMAYMKEQLAKKLEEGFGCIKIKVGALDFEKEIGLLQGIRRSFSPEKLEIRVDANGAFSLKDAADRLKRLYDLGIHSIEQPIKAGQWNEMARLCKESKLPIALDEELVGVNDWQEKKRLLKEINPIYIILKPSLLGGFRASEEWIALAEKNNIEWWATSALEGNVGLNAIAQWTALQQNEMHQGLGTGQVFSNNIPSPLQVIGGNLKYNQKNSWGNCQEDEFIDR